MIAVCTAVAILLPTLTFADVGLRDLPIATAVSSPTYLDTVSGGVWQASSPSLDLNINATVPGDLITDLQMAGVIPDPWLDTTWIVNSSLWSDHVWTYSTTFALPMTTVTTGLQDASTLLLVFDGVKMGATVQVNGKSLGMINDQFLRYEIPLDVDDLGLMASGNTLELTFGVNDSSTHEDGRFMACTGGWDWAPYSYTFTNSSNKTSGDAQSMSKGIWKSVYLVEVPTAGVAITHVTPHTKYNGSYPVQPLQDGNHGGFVVNVTTHFWVPQGGANGTLSLAGSWSPTGELAAVASSDVISLPAGESKISLQITASASQIDLWWPVGVGKQVLYSVNSTWTPTSGSSVSASRRFGFRVFALVTVNDTDAAYIAANASADGNAKHGMFFRVNGAAVYSRGANMIPMEELEGRMDSEAHRILVKSAADGGMNTLRVWGGGIFYPQAFYAACDEYGVMVYHDMQYNGNTGPHSPINSTTQARELRHQIRRLSHHPAIVLWDSCNECVVTPNTSSIVYATFVMTVVAQEDQMRVVWPSSPGPGWLTGVNRLYSTPNDSPSGLTVHGGGHIWNQGIETHGPYQLGSGWPTVNGGQVDSCFDNAGTGNGVSVPNNFQPGGPGGVAYQNTYASEFGTGGSSSFESMSGVLSPQNWGLHGGEPPDECAQPAACLGEHQCSGTNPMAQRNYGCDGQIRMYWGNHTMVDLTATGEAAFKGQTYQCQILQAFVLKQVYESRRSKNQLGHLVWMFNEIWPTVGWGSLEYGTDKKYSPGQLKGGRWKPLHYFFKNSLMTDVMATCAILYKRNGGGAPQCYISNHRASKTFQGTVTLTTYDHFGDGTGNVMLQKNFSLPEGPGAIEWFGIGVLPGNNTALISTVHDEVGQVVSEHMVQLYRPKHMEVPEAKLNYSIANQPNADGSIDITVSSDKVAIWVTLTSQAQGRFSDNVFFLPATTKVVQYIPFSSSTANEDLATLKQSLRLEDYSMYRALPSEKGSN